MSIARRQAQGQANPARRGAEGRSAAIACGAGAPACHPATLSSRHLAALSVCLLICLAACTLPGSTQPTFKIGLVAPFEGRYRPVGYDAIYAARLAVRQANATGGLHGYRIELIAYDDGGHPEMAARQARQLALDPAVMGVIGHFRSDTTQAAAPAYLRAGLALLAPANVPADENSSVLYLGPTTAQLSAALTAHLGADTQAHVASSADDALSAGQALVGLRQAGWAGVFAGGPDLALADFVKIAGPQVEGALFVTGAPWPQDAPGAGSFVADYTSVSGGAPPGPYAWAAYQAARVLFEAVGRDIQSGGRPSREGVHKQLCAVHPCLGSQSSPGLTAPVYVYRYDAAGRPVLVEVLPNIP